MEWIAGDVTAPLLDPDSVDLWHDRAVFHFLTDERGRDAYVEQVMRCVRSGGYVLIATFAPDGPKRCSGLDVARYDPDSIARVLGASLHKIAEDRETHETPSGGKQAFAYCLCQRT